MTVAIGQTTTTTVKEPRGRRWWLHPAMFWIVPLAIMVIVRFVWDGVAQRRLDAVVNEIRARGEPLEPSDYGEPVLSPSENAAALYARSEQLLPDWGHGPQRLNPIGAPGFSREATLEEVADCGQFVEMADESLELMRRRAN